MTDILDDLKKRLIDIGFKDPIIEKVVMEVRRDYGGERVYIAAQYEYHQEIAERNRQIIRAYKEGESTSALSKRFKLSKPRIHRIIKG